MERTPEILCRNLLCRLARYSFDFVIDLGASLSRISPSQYRLCIGQGLAVLGRELRMIWMPIAKQGHWHCALHLLAFVLIHFDEPDTILLCLSLNRTKRSVIDAFGHGHVALDGQSSVTARGNKRFQ